MVSLEKNHARNMASLEKNHAVKCPTAGKKWLRSLEKISGVSNCWQELVSVTCSRARCGKQLQVSSNSSFLAIYESYHCKHVCQYLLQWCAWLAGLTYWMYWLKLTSFCPENRRQHPAACWAHRHVPCSSSTTSLSHETLLRWQLPCVQHAIYPGQ